MNEKQSNEAREAWVERAMSSLDSMHRAEPQPFLYTRIQARLAEHPVRTVSISIAAASFGLLVAINAAVLFRSSPNVHPLERSQSSLSSTPDQLNHEHFELY